MSRQVFRSNAIFIPKDIERVTGSGSRRERRGIERLEKENKLKKKV
jgi:hypothetical protein